MPFSYLEIVKQGVWNKLIKLKDEFSRKEVTISEMEFRINNLLHQNQDVLVENERLRNELARLEAVSYTHLRAHET